jgi:hypothetical protein
MLNVAVMCTLSWRTTSAVVVPNQSLSRPTRAFDCQVSRSPFLFPFFAPKKSNLITVLGCGGTVLFLHPAYNVESCYVLMGDCRIPTTSLKNQGRQRKSYFLFVRVVSHNIFFMCVSFPSLSLRHW